MRVQKESDKTAEGSKKKLLDAKTIYICFS